MAVVDVPHDARRLLDRLAGRDDLVGVALLRSRSGRPVDPGDRDRLRHLAQAQGLGDLAGALDGLVATGDLGALTGACLAAAPFVQVVVDPGATPSADPGSGLRVGVATGRRLARLDPDDPEPVLRLLAPPPVRPLTASELDLLTAALAPPDVAREAWVRWRAGVRLDDWPAVARTLLTVHDRIGATGWALDPDGRRLRGVVRRNAYARRILGSTAVAVVDTLAAAGLDPVLVGDLADAAVGPGAVWWCDRIDVAVGPGGIGAAARILAAAGWSGPPDLPGELAPHRDHLVLLDPRGLRLHLSDRPLPRRGWRRVTAGRAVARIGDDSVPTLDATASLVRNWLVGAADAERTSRVVATAHLVHRSSPVAVDAALSAADALGVGGTARFHLGTIARARCA